MPKDNNVVQIRGFFPGEVSSARYREREEAKNRLARLIVDSVKVNDKPKFHVKH